MKDAEDTLRLGALRQIVVASSIWTDLVAFDRVGSTNDVAKRLASDGAPSGTVVVAEEQTAGRGRRQRRWVAPPHSSLLCSILLRPDLAVSQVHRLTMACSMAASDAIADLADLEVGIKWPNDLVVDRRLSDPGAHGVRKLGGILTETGLAGSQPDFVVVGMGINVNIACEDLVKVDSLATSISAETARWVDRTELLTALLSHSEARYLRLEAGENPCEQWSARLVTLGRPVRVATPNGILHGVAESVDPNGALLLRTGDGSLRRLLAGDVTLAAT